MRLRPLSLSSGSSFVVVLQPPRGLAPQIATASSRHSSLASQLRKSSDGGTQGDTRSPVEPSYGARHDRGPSQGMQGKAGW